VNINEVLPEGFDSLEDALTPADFKEDALEEQQLFLTPWQMVARRFFRNKLAVAGLAVLLTMVFMCVILPIFYPYSETELFYRSKETGEQLRSSDSEQITNAVLSSLEAPSSEHIFGTNVLGQDEFARLMYGGRVSLIIGFAVVIVELIIGVILGGLAGYYRGAVDRIIMRLVEIISSVPTVPLWLIISMLMITLNVSPRYKIYYTMVVLGCVYWTSVARMVRGNIFTLREMEFIQAAEATGISTRRKIFSHLIPNTLPNLIVSATMDLGSVILLESTLSFLGVGVGVPYASWGNMVSEVSDNIVMQNYPALWIAPGLCILLTVLSFNFIGDGLRDATDPKMKDR